MPVIRLLFNTRQLHRPPPSLIHKTYNHRSLVRPLSTTSSLSRFDLGRWLYRKGGMRRRIGAWAESFGLVEPVAGSSRDFDGTGVDQAGRGLEEVQGEELYVMPGWAVIKYRDEQVSDGAPAPFDIHLSLSGFCSRARPPSKVTRTQRVMLSIVRRFAALPGINPEEQPMGPLPTAVGMAMLEAGEEEDRHHREAEREQEKEPVKSYGVYKSKRRIPPPITTNIPPLTPNGQRPLPTRSSSTFSISSTDTAFIGREAIEKAHDTLNKRLAPFWSAILPNRRVLVDIYATPPDRPVSESDDSTDDQPLASFQLVTDANGHFSKVVRISWDQICTTPSAVPLAFTSQSQQTEWRLRIRTRLDYEVFGDQEAGGSYRDRIRRAVSTYGIDANDRPAQEDRGLNSKLNDLSLNTPGEPQVVVNTPVRLGLANGIHLISDLDDTVKHSDILAGPREVFRNVFCRPLDEICVPGMNSLYTALSGRGVGINGFHFVSNSPSQLFPSITRFLTLNEFPDRRSIKLKYYGGRSIFSSLYESPAERKRASLRELFDSFPDARFVMVGDSAEQDLELYMEYSRLYEGRVGMVAIRDVTSDRADAVWQVLGGASGGASAYTNGEPPLTTISSTTTATSTPAISRTTSSASLAPNPSSSDPIATSTPTSAPSLPGAYTPAPRPVLRPTTSSVSVTEEELASLSSSQQKILQRAATWQSRMRAAREGKPKGTEVVFFKTAEELEGVLGAWLDQQ